MPLAIGPDAKKDACKTNRIASIIPVVDQQRFIHELSQVQHILDSGVPVTPLRTMSAGQQVRIKSGTLMGLTGEIIKHGSSSDFIIRVEMLNHAVKVHLHELDLEPV